MKIAIVTTRHWTGDPRLNRHAEYLRAGGHLVEIQSCAHQGRLSALLSAAREMLKADADAVILPDPDFFAIGALLARARGSRPVIDIHEDYPKAARNRSWIPEALKPVVSVVARSMVMVGRFLAWKVIVAAPQLARPGDAVVLNIPDPAVFRFDHEKDQKLIVYVGDITHARGAVDMLQALAGLPDEYVLKLIGPITSETRSELEGTASRLGISSRVQLAGRLDHHNAWLAASEAQYGLNLLRDTPAYRDAVATKLWEYMASGVIPIVTDLTGQAALISSLDPELVCSGSADVASVISRLAGDPKRVRQLSDRARDMAEKEWERSRPDVQIQAVFAP